jgi:hypothetical protein
MQMWTLLSMLPIWQQLVRMMSVHNAMTVDGTATASYQFSVRHR